MIKSIDMQECWKQFIENDIICGSVRDIIAQSWIRSKDSGIDPYHKASGLLVPEKEFKEILKKNKDLIRIAKPIMEQLYKIVEGSKFEIVLADAEGYLLEVIGDDDLKKISEEFLYLKGSRWIEEKVGTNAISLAIEHDIPIQMTGAESYKFAHHISTACCSPIHDYNGNIIGVLNMTGLSDNFFSHTLGIVIASVSNIEKQLEMEKKNRLIEDTFITITEGILITDRNLKVVRVNRVAEQIYQKKRNEMMGTNIQDFVNEGIWSAFIKKNGIENYEMTIEGNRKKERVLISIFPMIEHDKFYGVTIILKTSDRVKKMINQVVGNEARFTFNDIVTINKRMLKIIESAKRIAKTSCSVLITGESGTGKELFAQSIHNESWVSDGPFVAINCAAIPRELVESELFGYEKGAFTGGLAEGKPGKFELADGGTIFLDEIGELPLEVQSKLLRVLDSHEVTRLGGKHARALNVRIIAATNRDLLQESLQKNFRSDLFYRLNVINFQMIPLRDRIEDIPLLINHFINKLNLENTKAVAGISNELLNYLKTLSWTGNIRELQNMISRVYYLYEEGLLSLECLPKSIFEQQIKDRDDSKASVSMTSEVIPLAEMEKQNIIKALKKRRGKAILAAKDLHMGKSTLYRKLKKYHIDINEFLN